MKQLTGCLLLMFCIVNTSAHCDCQDEIAQMRDRIETTVTVLSSLIDGVQDGEGLNGDILTRLSEFRVFRGSPGKNGTDGRDGINGKDGQDGAEGARGPEGSPGDQGPPGTNGSSGNPGNNGVDGQPGEDGKDGKDGQGGAVDSGAVYTRWGRNICGSEATLLYAGFAGNTPYTQPGGGVNYQCLPLSAPEYNKYDERSSGWGNAFMAGTEYQSDPLFKIFPSNAHDQNVPCARCYAQGRVSQMMIPSKRTCPDHWTKEYEGYLMAERDGHAHASTFECVDSEPEYIRGLEANNDGALFYFTLPFCTGTFTTGHCPPFVNKRQLTCVVCTR